jgi:hypothetical protein
MLRRRVRSDNCRPAGGVSDNVAAPEHFRDLTPNWLMRIRRAIIGIGFVWLFIGAGVTTYYTVTGQTSDTIRGVLTMLLGTVTATIGLLWARRARHSRARPSTTQTKGQPIRSHGNDGAAP